MSQRCCVARAGILSLVVAITFPCLPSVAVRAATKAERTAAAGQLVQEALHREIYGLDWERGKLLDEALLMRRRMGDAHGSAVSLGNLGILELDAGHPGSALQRLDDARALLERAGYEAELDIVQAHRALALALLPAVMTDLLLEHPQMSALFQQALHGDASPGQELMRGWLDRLLAQGVETARGAVDGPIDRADLAIQVVAMFNVTTGYFLSQRALDSLGAGDLADPGRDHGAIRERSEMRCPAVEIGDMYRSAVS